MKSCISNIFFDYGDAPLTLFLRLRDILNNRKSLMTLMTGNASKHLFVFLVKHLPCLSHCFCSPIVGFYQQWAFVILHNLDPD